MDLHESLGNQTPKALPEEGLEHTSHHTFKFKLAVIYCWDKSLEKVMFRFNVFSLTSEAESPAGHACLGNTCFFLVYLRCRAAPRDSSGQPLPPVALWRRCPLLCLSASPEAALPTPGPGADTDPPNPRVRWSGFEARPAVSHRVATAMVVTSLSLSVLIC